MEVKARVETEMITRNFILSCLCQSVYEDLLSFGECWSLWFFFGCVKKSCQLKERSGDYN